MQSDRELMQQALEALEIANGMLEWRGIYYADIDQAIASLRERLAQPEQEPVAWMYVNMDGECEQIEYLENEPMPDDPSITPLYTAPPRREWRGLSDDNLEDLLGFHCDIYGEMNEVDAKKFAADIEKRLKEKNA